MNKEPIILVGGGGHCVSSIDVIEQTNKYEIIGIVDLPEKIGQKVLNYEIIGTDSDIPKLRSNCKNFHISAGQIKSTELRIRLFNTIKDVKGNLPIIISPYAYVSKYSIIEEGSIIMHNALVNAAAKIGKCAIVNTKALIEHEVEIGNFCHISTAAIINGQCKIGSESFIGSNSIIINNIDIPAKSIIAAGTRVFKTIDKPGTYF